MSISNEITRITNNIAAAYNAAQEKGATMPATKNSDNLATCIDSITGDSESSETPDVPIFGNTLSLRGSSVNIDSDGTVDFSSSSTGYIQIPTNFVTYTGETFYFHIRTGSSVSTEQEVFHCQLNADLAIYNSNFRVYNWETDEQMTFSTIFPAVNTEYYVSVTFNSDNTITTKVGTSEDLSNAESITTPRRPNNYTFPYGFNLGYSLYSSAPNNLFKGKIYLQDCYAVDLSGNKFWQGISAPVLNVTYKLPSDATLNTNNAIFDNGVLGVYNDTTYQTLGGVQYPLDLNMQSGDVLELKTKLVLASRSSTTRDITLFWLSNSSGERLWLDLYNGYRVVCGTSSLSIYNYGGAPTIGEAVYIKATFTMTSESTVSLVLSKSNDDITYTNIGSTSNIGISNFDFNSLNLGAVKDFGYDQPSYLINGNYFLDECQITKNGNKVRDLIKLDKNTVQVGVTKKEYNTTDYNVSNLLGTSTLITDKQAGYCNISTFKDSESRLTTKENIDLSKDSWEIVISVLKAPTQGTNPLGIFGAYSSDYADRFKLPLISYRQSNTSRIDLFLSSDGANWDIVSEKYITNTFTFMLPHCIKLAYDYDTQTYTLAAGLLQDNLADIVYSTSTTFTGSPVYANSSVPLSIGYNLQQQGSPLTDGSIDFARSYIKIGDDIRYMAVDIV